jgi:DnaJ-class molecular chaperone
MHLSKGNMSYKTHYDTLEVESNATYEQIKETYRLLATMLHPDKFPEGSRQQEMATRKMQAINAAWETLRDPDSRAAYDATLSGTTGDDSVTEQFTDEDDGSDELSFWELLRDADQVHRRDRGECIFCGAPLTFLDRMCGRKKHVACLLYEPDDRTRDLLAVLMHEHQ